MQTVPIPMEELAKLLKLQLDDSGTAQLIVTGMSMWPMLTNRRDQVTLALPPETYCKGDLILYRRDCGSYVLHRIVRIAKDGTFICSGDNQWLPEKVCPQQVFAIVTAFCRKGIHYPVTHCGYRCYVSVWVTMFPLRRPILVLKNLFLRLRQRLRAFALHK